MKLVVDCEAYGAPSVEHIESLKEEALRLLEAGKPDLAVNVMQQAVRAQETKDRPVEQLVKLTKEELAQREKDAEVEKERQLEEIRSERNALLAASDWTQVVDAPLTDSERAAWAKYRQALRDNPVDPEKWGGYPEG